MKSKLTITLSALVLVAMLALGAGGALAQDGLGGLVDTVTVTGTGSAYGTPDVATIDIGVEHISENITEAFNLTNAAIDAVIESLMELGIAREDIRTVGFNVYAQDAYGMAVSTMEGGDAPQRSYNVSNIIQVTVRDFSLVEAALETAISNGANNIFGLNFGIADTAALEQAAREEAMADARARAEHIATLMGATLGDAVVVIENSGGFFGPVAMADAGFGGGGARVEAEQLAVSVSLQVTFRVNR